MASTVPPTELIPLVEDEAGTFHLAQTRITLDVFAESFRQGSTPEQMADQFPSLPLADIYAVITWMLRNPEELSHYLSRRAAEAAEVREKVEKHCPPGGLRSRLLTRSINPS